MKVAVANPIKVTDASTAGGFRVAGRRLVTTYLTSVLSLEDEYISCFDVDEVNQKICLVHATLLYFWDIEKCILISTVCRILYFINKAMQRDRFYLIMAKNYYFL
jgi:hypothetical protein